MNISSKQEDLWSQILILGQLRPTTLSGQNWMFSSFRGPSFGGEQRAAQKGNYAQKLKSISSFCFFEYRDRSSIT